MALGRLARRLVAHAPMRDRCLARGRPDELVGLVQRLGLHGRGEEQEGCRRGGKGEFHAISYVRCPEIATAPERCFARL